MFCDAGWMMLWTANVLLQLVMFVRVGVVGQMLAVADTC